MKVLLLLTAIAVGVSPVVARVGETEDQLITRFGPPTSRGVHRVAAQGRSYDLGHTMAFKEGDWRISCDIVDGRCARLSYSKVGDWTEEHFQTVMNANSQGGTWSDSSKPNFKKALREWKRSDGGTAKWTLGTMIITVPAYNRAKEIAEAKGKAAAAKPAKI